MPRSKPIKASGTKRVMVPDTKLQPIYLISDGDFSRLCREYRIPKSKREWVRNALDKAAEFAEIMRQDRSQHRPRSQDAATFDAFCKSFREIAVWFRKFDTVHLTGHSIQVVDSLSQSFLNHAAGKHLGKVLRRDFITPIRRDRVNHSAASGSKARVSSSELISGNPGDVLFRLTLTLGWICIEVRNRLRDVSGPDRLFVVRYLISEIADIYYAALNKIPGSGKSGPFHSFLENVFEGLGLEISPSERMVHDVIASWRQRQELPGKRSRTKP
jgi:hypothetical protein